MKPRRELPHDVKILLICLAAGLPGVVVAAWLAPAALAGTSAALVIAFVAATWLLLSLQARTTVVRPLAVLANLLAGLRLGDFSVRAREGIGRDPLSVVFSELNTLGGLLHEHRLGALEALALVRKMMAELDAAVFAFDAEGNLRMANDAAGELLHRAVPEMLGRSAGQLALEECFRGERHRTLMLAVGRSSRRFQLRRNSFRQQGRPMTLIVLTDVSEAVREEERESSRRLIRVLGHEINNSLAPIGSISATLASLLRREELPSDWKEDLVEGLRVIENRAGALGRFMSEYSRLSRLPAPSFSSVDVRAWVRRVVALETAVPIEVEDGGPCQIEGDGDQLEQLLINISRNACEAAREARGHDRPWVWIGWKCESDELVLQVRDNGAGLAPSENLFVPFFSTKVGGSGIGLVLSRQIAEAHGGSLEIHNHPEGGAEVILQLPTRRRSPSPDAPS
jgi:two-component system, NtrC family, nitrogen regulation sensor histidine kinase NtrY